MVKSLCSSLAISSEDPMDVVILTVKDVREGSRYKISIKECPRGTFIYNEDKAFDHYSDNLGRVTADFICIGRYHDVNDFYDYMN